MGTYLHHHREAIRLTDLALAGIDPYDTLHTSRYGAVERKLLLEAAQVHAALAGAAATAMDSAGLPADGTTASMIRRELTERTVDHAPCVAAGRHLYEGTDHTADYCLPRLAAAAREAAEVTAEPAPLAVCANCREPYREHVPYGGRAPRCDFAPLMAGDDQ